MVFGLISHMPNAVCSALVSLLVQHFLLSQDVEVMLGEAVRFVPDVLEQLESR
jgi:hypothetical protein